ncbi:flagellin, partial [Microvirga flocculans]
FSISTQMKSDNGALSAVKDSIKQSKAMIDTFNSALSKIQTYLDKVKQVAVSGQQPGAQYTEINSELAAHAKGIVNSADAAKFNGENWLVQDSGTVATKNLVFSFASNAGAADTVGKLAVDMTKTEIFDAAGGTGGNLGALITSLNAGITDATTSGTLLNTVDTAIDYVKTAAATLGATKALLETQEEFIGVLSDSLTAGVSAFVDADMNEASTRFQALQTQQQLGVQALSMANQNSQMILRLFQ